MSSTETKIVKGVLSSLSSVSQEKVGQAIAILEGKTLNNNAPVLVKLQTAADLCNVSRQTFWAWVKAGKISPVTIIEGGAKLYRHSDIQKLAEVA